MTDSQPDPISSTLLGEDISAALWAGVEDAYAALTGDPHSDVKLSKFRAEMAAFTAHFSGEAVVH
jgi:hypothetical protein